MVFAGVLLGRGAVELLPVGGLTIALPEPELVRAVVGIVLVEIGAAVSAVLGQ